VLILNVDRVIESKRYWVRAWVLCGCYYEYL